MEFWLASYPRSGNSYFRILLRNRYDIPSIDEQCPDELEIATLRGTRFLRAHHRELSESPAILGIKTHNPPTPGDTKPAVYIVRDGRDALVSYAHFALASTNASSKDVVTPEILRDTIRDLILEPNSPYWTWSKNVDAWVARKNTVLIHFEDLIANPGRAADRAVAGLGLGIPIASTEIPTFKELKSVDPQFFRKGQKGEWREVFTADLYDLFWQHNGATMTRLGYPHLPPLRPVVSVPTQPPAAA